MLREPDDARKRLALWSLGRLGRAAAPAALDMAACVESGSPEVCREALAALALICPEGPEAAARLLALAQDPEEPRRSLIVGTLAEMGSDGILDELVRGVEANDASRAGVLCHWIGHLGDAGRPAVPALLRLLARSEGQDRPPVLSALGLVGKGQPMVIAWLRPLLSASDVPTRFEAAVALARLGDRDTVRPFLARAVVAQEEAASRSVGEAIALLGPSASEFTPGLVRWIVREREWSNTDALMVAARSISPASGVALRDLARDDDPDVRMVAHRLLAAPSPM
jgi:HEAT repeat protein